MLFGVEVEGVDEAQAAEGEADADADVKGKGKETAKDEGIFSLEDTASAAPVEPTEPKRSEAWKGSLGRTFKPSSMFEWGGWNRGADSESSSVSSYESDDGWRCPECQLYLDAGGIVDDLAGDDFFVTEQERDDEVVRLMGGAVNAPPPMVGGGGGGKGKERERESDGEGGSKYDAAYWSRLEMLGNSALRDAGGTLPEEEKDVDVDVDGKGKGRA